jgi:hypothetical protein
MKNLIFLSLVVLISLGSNSCSNFIESKFQLSEDSRLPRWSFDRNNLTRGDILVEILFYGPPGDKIKIIYYDKTKNNQKIIAFKGFKRYSPETQKKIDDIK